MRDQIISVAVVEADVKGLDQAARANLLTKQIRIHERQPLAAQRVLHGQNRGIEDESSLDVEGMQIRLAHALRPEMMPR